MVDAGFSFVPIAETVETHPDVDDENESRRTLRHVPYRLSVAGAGQFAPDRRGEDWQKDQVGIHCSGLGCNFLMRNSRSNAKGSFERVTQILAADAFQVLPGSVLVPVTH